MLVWRQVTVMFGSYIVHQRLRPFLVMQTVSVMRDPAASDTRAMSSGGGSRWRSVLQFFSHQVSPDKQHHGSVAHLHASTGSVVRSKRKVRGSDVHHACLCTLYAHCAPTYLHFLPCAHRVSHYFAMCARLTP
jgi:hypothetical protein